jgi:heavy metal sensor kinase
VSIEWAKRLGARIAISYLLVLICAMVLFMTGTALVLFMQMQSQLKHYAIQDIETVEGLVSVTPQNEIRVSEDYHNHPESKRVLDRFLEIRSPEGHLLYRNERLGGRSLGGAPVSNEGVNGYSERSARLEDGTRAVLVSRRHSVNGRPILIRLAYSQEPIWASVHELIGAALIMLPIMIAVAAIAGYRMSRRALAPVEQITRQAERITSKRLHERIPVAGGGDELTHLTQVFNQMLAHLDESFQQLRRFTSDASHELRTPLAAIRSIGEVGLQSSGTREEYRELIGSMLEEVNRLTRLVDELLMISRADSGVIPLNYSLLSISDLIRDTMALLEPLAEEKQQRLTLTQSDDVCVNADAMYLRQALINVLHNAIKYSPPQSTISMRFERSGPDSVMIAIQDSGPGIGPEDMTRIFDRFYRVDQGRSREAGGFGLGLAIAHWAVHANGGAIDVTSAVGRGSTFRITLPLSAGA